MRNAALVCLLLLAVGVARADDVPATGDHAIVVTAERQATLAALAVLREGGSAADAVIAGGFVLGVTEPFSSGLGGGGFLVGYQRQGGVAYALDARETAPAGATRDMFLDAGGRADAERSCTGALSVAVPGLVRGFADLHRRFGRLPWSRLCQPAIEIARDGFPVSTMLAARLREELDAGRLDPGLQAVFLPEGRVPEAGTILRQPDLARTLAAISAGGESAFYDGPIAAAIVDAVAARGGVLCREDLAGYRTVWREPVRGTYRGYTVLSMPPPSSGGVHLVQMLNILGPFDLAVAGYGSVPTWHLMLEAMKLAFADRSRFLGDPDFADVPVAMLLGRAHADSQRARIRPDIAIPVHEIAGAPLVADPPHTTHLSIVDGEGNAVAATLTINLSFGAGLVAGQTGIVLNDEMDDFTTAPGVPNAFGLVQGTRNEIGPGRRPLSSMTPTLLLAGDDVYMVTGSSGGSRIISATLQTIVHVVDFGMDARQAVAAPRIHHQWRPATGWYEEYGMSPETRRGLEERGHVLTARATIGNVQVIVRDLASGRWTGASDPRGMGLAAGY
ncbi:MAG TPA: gamma-glutamyltransferase [Candidatus Krumholzibacteria bacterium]|nr:gamma-glutamyltransferase [Candidatus Krumholzibacteria bacterium]HPD71214.1 gamma-glutamyltransferase [Candidatus Krumholzibacteria bacterium]HRY39086.1 gamma-glutamyltransferase [Candidatus Krumholzibacteria bacterium]